LIDDAAGGEIRPALKERGFAGSFRAVQIGATLHGRDRRTVAVEAARDGSAKGVADPGGFGLPSGTA
jgi:hypothetical protein